jgi:hypothetical protein
MGKLLHLKTTHGSNLSQGFMITYNLLNSVGTISYFFPTLMNALGYRGRMAQCGYSPLLPADGHQS